MLYLLPSTTKRKKTNPEARENEFEETCFNLNGTKKVVQICEVKTLKRLSISRQRHQLKLKPMSGLCWFVFKWFYTFSKKSPIRSFSSSNWNMRLLKKIFFLFFLTWGKGLTGSYSKDPFIIVVFCWLPGNTVALDDYCFMWLTLGI